MAKYTWFYYVYLYASDVFYLVISWLIVAIIARSPWRQHLKWAIPEAIAASCFLGNRGIADLHHFGHFGSYMPMLEIRTVVWYAGSLLNIYGVCKFYVIVKQSLQAAAGKDLFTQPFGEAEPGVWPPPPRIQP